MRSFTRIAEGIEVRVTEPSPRRVRIMHERTGEAFPMLSLQEAQGLVYALTNAVNDAIREDTTQ